MVAGKWAGVVWVGKNTGRNSERHYIIFYSLDCSWLVNHGNRAQLLFRGRNRAYSKRAVQPICAVQDAICAVQNEKLCSPKIHNVMKA